MDHFNPFSTNVPLLYPPESIRKPKGYRGGTLVENGLIKIMKPVELYYR